MKPRQKTEYTLQFTLELLKRIPKGRKVTASDLHQQMLNAGFECNLRTVQRQLKSLCESFDVLCDDSDKPYGYSWNKESAGFSLPMLSEQESILLTLAQEYLANLLPANLMTSMSGFFEQAKHNLAPYQSQTGNNKKSAGEWLSKVAIVSATQPLLPPKISSGVFEAVSRALYENKWLSVVYANAKGYQKSYRVMPLGLAQQDTRLYLVCRFEGYDDERNLALHRIKSAEISTLTFKQPCGFNLAKYVEAGRFGFGDGEIVEVTFKLTKVAGNHLYETKLSRDQTIQVHENHLTVKAQVIDSEMLDSWLRSFGDDVWGINKEVIND